MFEKDDPVGNGLFYIARGEDYDATKHRGVEPDLDDFDSGRKVVAVLIPIMPLFQRRADLPSFRAYVVGWRKEWRYTSSDLLQRHSSTPEARYVERPSDRSSAISSPALPNSVVLRTIRLHRGGVIGEYVASPTCT